MFAQKLSNLLIVLHRTLWQAPSSVAMLTVMLMSRRSETHATWLCCCTCICWACLQHIMPKLLLRFVLERPNCPCLKLTQLPLCPSLKAAYTPLSRLSLPILSCETFCFPVLSFKAAQ